MSLVVKNSKYPIGLDFSDYNLKIVQLDKKRDKISLQAMGKIDLPLGAINNGEILNTKLVTESLKKLINSPEKGKVTSNTVVACLPETKTFLKLIKVEDGPNPIESIIESEIEKHIPLSCNDLYFDWQIIKQQKGVSHILVGACPKNIVNRYIEVLKNTKLNIAALEIEAVAISRSLLTEEKPKSKIQKNKNYAIIDMGKKRTSLFVYSKNTPIFTISLPISGALVTSEIAKTLDIEEDQADKAKIICGLDETKAKGIIKNLLTTSINSLLEKINDSVNYFENHFPELGEINKIILCGGASNIKDLSKYISESTEIETELGNSLKNINTKRNNLDEIFTETHKIKTDFTGKQKDSKSMTLIQNNAISYTTAIGLALRNIFIKNF